MSRLSAGLVSNAIGKVVGPLSEVSGFHGAGPVHRALGMRRVMTVRAQGGVGAEAVVHALPKVCMTYERLENPCQSRNPTAR